MSVSSRKTTVTTDRPYFEIERTSVVRGMPAIARSTGTLMYCSTSTGDKAGAAVMTCIWTLVTSGTASIGRLAADRRPIAMNRTVVASTIGRFFKDHETTADRNASISILLAERSLQNLVF